MDKYGKVSEILGSIQQLTDTAKSKIHNPDKRLRYYFDHFVNTSQYDEATQSAIISNVLEGEKHQNEDLLLNFLETGAGTCLQFSSALSLATFMDGRTPLCHTAAFATRFKDQKSKHYIGHAVNILRNDGIASTVIDLTSSICNPLNRDKFFTINEYMEYTASKGFEPYPVLKTTDGKGVSMIGLKMYNDIYETYDTQIAPTDENLKKDRMFDALADVFLIIKRNLNPQKILPRVFCD
jgi:hypothetical protein